MLIRRPVALRPLAPLDASLGYWLRFVGTHVAHALRLRIEKFGVTVSEWLAMRELYRLDSCSQRALAFELGMTESAMSRLVERLHAKGLVERSRASEGKRQWRLCLTPVGRSLVPSLESIAAENDSAFFGYLTAGDREELTAFLRQVARRQRLKPMPLVG